MPLVFICDNTISMLVKLYNKESILEVANKFFRLLFASINYPFLHYVALYQHGETTHGLQFRKSSQIIVELFNDLLKNWYLNLQGEFRFTDAVKYCDGELTKIWGTNTPNIIIVLTDGGKQSQYYQEEIDQVDLNDNFRSIVHTISFTNHMCESIRKLSEQTGGISLCAKSEWKDTLNGDDVAEKLFAIFKQTAFHLYHSEALISLGHLKMNVKLFPFVDLNYFNDSLYCFENPNDLDITNLVVDIYGFLSLVDLNYPCSISDHVVIYETGTTSGIITFQNSTNNPTKLPDSSEDSNHSLNFALLLNTGLMNTKTAAMCSIHYKNNDVIRHGFIRNFVTGENKYSLKLCLFPKDYTGLSWVGKFTHLNPCSDFPEIYGNVDSKSPFPIKIRGDCSYKVNSEESYQYTTWISAQSSVVNDFSKIIRICKRLPERKLIFYKEINRLRETALAIGSKGLLNQLCFMLQRESINITNVDAQAVIRYAVENMTNNPHEMLVDKK